MASKASEDTLGSLHGALTAALIKRIKDNSATAADLGVAARLLKDNGITAAKVPGGNLDQLSHLVPFATEEDAEVY